MERTVRYTLQVWMRSTETTTERVWATDTEDYREVWEVEDGVVWRVD